MTITDPLSQVSSGVRGGCRQKRSEYEEASTIKEGAKAVTATLKAPKG